jgi:PAS domain S-box-containing protein
MAECPQYEADRINGVNRDGVSEEQSLINAQLRAAANAMPAHVWYATSSGVLVFVNSRIADYLALPEDHPLRFGIDDGGEWDSHIAFLHPDDHEETRKVWSACLRTGCPSEVAFRGRDAEGRYRWFLSRAEPVRAANGSVLFWIGVNFDIDAQKRAEQEIRDIIETIPAIVWVALPDGSNTYVNSRYVEYSGVTSEQTAGAGWQMAVHPDDLQRHEGKWRASVASGVPHESEVRFRRADGQYRWHLDRGQPLLDEDGNILRWYGVVTDIEDRKRVEEALRRNEHFLAEAQRLSHTGSAGMEAGSKRMFWSEETARIYGYAPGTEPTPDLILQRVHPDDVDLLKSVLERAGQAGSDFDFEHRLLMPDGSIKYIRNLAHPLRYGDGHEESVGAIMDITEHKLAEEAIRRSEAYLAEAQRLSHTGSWVWNVENRGAIHLSEEWYRIYGFDPAEGPPDWERRLARVHPEDRFKWKDVIEKAILEEADYEVDFRIVLPDGKLKWIHTVGHPVITSSGNLVRFLGSSTDITERKQAEEKLKEQEMELRQVLDLAPQLIAVFGPLRERLYLNLISLDYFGITLDQWCEARPGTEVHPDDTERLRSQWGRAISSSSAFEIEVRFRRNDGVHRWFLIRCNPVRDDRGKVLRWYAACTDIEDRKRAEESLQRENAALREELNQSSMFEEIVGSSEPLRKVLLQVSKVALTDSTILILGQTGTGKELIARAIHKRSRRAGRPFIGVNCGAIPASLVASELFGHEKGAFTGATQRRLGRFEAANGGTIFLDEVGDLPPDIQIALLRVLQEREIERVGSDRPIPVEVRVLAATHRDLDKLVSEGKFRQDLLYRLNVVPIAMPSLRERAADIPILVEYFIARYGKRMGKKFQTVEKKTLKLLQDYDWPGNVRELQNVIERAVTLSDSDAFAVDEAWLKREPAKIPHSSAALNGVLLAHEKEVIEAALAQSHGRISGPAGAAAKLGVPDSTLEAKIKRLGIDKYRFKSQVG